MDDETLKIYAYIIVSKYRERVVKVLKGGNIRMRKTIIGETGILTNHIDKTLKELKNAGVIECINEQAYRGKLYRLTPTGEEIAKKLK